MQVCGSARAMSSRDMESIAVGYLDIEEETIKNFKEWFSRVLIEQWTNKNGRPNQCQVSFSEFCQMKELET